MRNGTDFSFKVGNLALDLAINYESDEKIGNKAETWREMRQVLVSKLETWRWIWLSILNLIKILGTKRRPGEKWDRF